MDIRAQERIINEFIDLLGQPSSMQILQDYIDICSEPEVDETVYSEIHHILPRCKFPQFENLNIYNWNSVSLNYNNHIKAHYLLAKSYPIAQFTKPMNMMLSGKYDNLDRDDVRLINSTRAKACWENLSELDKTAFSIKRSIFMKSAMQPGNKTFDSVQEGCRLRYENPLNLQANRDMVKSVWAKYAPEERSNIMKERSLKVDVEHRSAKLKERYEDVGFMSKFTETMTAVNKDESKRKEASVVLKEMWKDDTHRNKVIASRQTSEAKAKRLMSFMNAKPDAWSLCGEVFDIWNSDKSLSSYRISTIMKLDRKIELGGMVDRFKSGWIPASCPIYKQWKENR